MSFNIGDKVVFDGSDTACYIPPRAKGVIEGDNSEHYPEEDEKIYDVRFIDGMGPGFDVNQDVKESSLSRCDD